MKQENKPSGKGQMRVKAHVLDAEGIRKALKRIAHEILERHPAGQEVAIVGIRLRGEFLAQRLAAMLKEISGREVPVGALDINLYRDDLSLRSGNPVVRATEIPFDVTDKKLIIIDDVLYTGRTIRSAMDALTDLGRPELVELAILVDRGHRELPIKADYVGKNVPTSQSEVIQVCLLEVDGEDSVRVEEVA